MVSPVQAALGVLLHQSIVSRINKKFVAFPSLYLFCALPMMKPGF